MLSDYIKYQQDRQRMSITALAEKSGVSVSTICRIRSGENDNPSWVNIVAIVQAMGGSLDAAADISPEGILPDPASAAALQQRIADLERAVTDANAQLDRERAYHTEDRRADRQEAHILRRVVLGLVCALVALCYLLVDAMNPEWGVFRNTVVGALDVPHLLVTLALCVVTVALCAWIVKKGGR